MPINDIDLLEQDIDRFLGSFRNNLLEIRELSPSTPRGLFQKILYFSILDSLSRTTAQVNQGNRRRTLSFVRGFCDWPDSERISLPHLIRLLEKYPDPSFSSLSEHAFAMLDQWDRGEIIPITTDPEIHEMDELWPKHFPNLGGVPLASLQHSNLFYESRNILVHELRKSGYCVESPTDEAPFYCSTTDLDAGKETWELVYPVKFYEKLCSAAIENLKGFYLKNGINPYSCYAFGSYWMEDLNR